MNGIPRLRNVNWEELLECMNLLFDELICDHYKQEDKVVNAIINESFEECKQETKQTLDKTITLETVYGLSPSEIQQKFRSILQPIEDKYEKKKIRYSNSSSRI
jgi:predicted nucleic-acid-binding protein